MSTTHRCHQLLSRITQYPDTDEDKEVFVQAAGPRYLGEGSRHVLIMWFNHFSKSQFAAQVVQLVGKYGDYHYDSPVVELRHPRSLFQNQAFKLGTFSRTQRDTILRLAATVEYHKNSMINGCRVWTRDLLESMVKCELITKEQFNAIDKAIPLVKRHPEVTLQDQLSGTPSNIDWESYNPAS